MAFIRKKIGVVFKNPSIWSLSLRATTALLKFSLLLYLAKLIEPTELGKYALIVAITAISVQFFGLEFHAVNSRRITSSSKTEISTTIQEQFWVQAAFHLFGIPVVLLFTHYFLEINSLAILLPILIFVEHASQEFTRFTQFLLKPITCAALGFIRGGAWVCFIFIAFETGILAPSLAAVISFWVLFATLSAVVGLICTKEFFEKNQFHSFSKTRLKSLFFASTPFFFIAIATSLAVNFDKFVLTYFLDLSSVGVFYFYFSLASAIGMAVNYGVGIIYGPKAISAFRNQGVKQYGQIKVKLVAFSLLYATAASIALLTFINPILFFLNKTQYEGNLALFVLLIISQNLLVVADFFNMDLYVRNMDIEILLVGLLHITFVGVSQIYFVSEFGLVGAGIAACISGIMLILARYFAFFFGLKRQPSLSKSVRLTKHVS